VNYISPDGERASTEAAYLTPEVLKRPNLKVVVHAHVTKLLISVKGNEKRVVGVEFAPEGMPAQRYRVKSKKEVVLT
jgi:choline dehydrogenase